MEAAAAQTLPAILSLPPLNVSQTTEARMVGSFASWVRGYDLAACSNCFRVPMFN